MPEEERRISPAIIIPIGLVGLAAIAGIAALAWSARRGAIGDVNDDGVVDWTDAHIIAAYLAMFPISEISPLSEEEFLRRADFNGDGIVDIADVLALALTLPPEEEGVTYLPL